MSWALRAVKVAGAAGLLLVLLSIPAAKPILGVYRTRIYRGLDPSDPDVTGGDL